MNKIMIGLVIVGSMFLSGCDTNDERDIDISSTTHYINTTESVDIKAYNGFRLIGSKSIKNEDGSYQIILDFNKLFE